MQGGLRSVIQEVRDLGESQTMLVLSRKRNESVVINENIVVTVVEVRGDRVRLGIQAPRDVPIHRSEIMAAIQQEQAVGATETPTSTNDQAQS